LHEEVKKYLDSDYFKTAFAESRALMILMNEKNQELFKPKIDTERIEKEYADYCKKVFE